MTGPQDEDVTVTAADRARLLHYLANDPATPPREAFAAWLGVEPYPTGEVDHPDAPTVTDGPGGQFTEIITAMVRGEVLDGTPITSQTIGPLTRKYAEALAAEYGVEGQGDGSDDGQGAVNTFCGPGPDDPASPVDLQGQQ